MSRILFVTSDKEEPFGAYNSSDAVMLLLCVRMRLSPFNFKSNSLELEHPSDDRSFLYNGLLSREENF